MSEEIIEPVIDPVVFSEMQELLDDALGSFIETYLDNSPQLLENINQALGEGDLQAIYNNTHQLKGGSGSIGAMQVFQVSRQMEEMSREGKAEGLSELFSELQTEYAQAEQALKEYL